MNYILIVLKVFLVFVFIPGTLGLYIEKAKSGTGRRYQNWITKNIYIVILLIVVGVGVLLEIRSYSESKPIDEKPLKFLELDHYQKELEQHPNAKKSQDWVKDKTSLIRKFKHVFYAWEKMDYEEAVNSLLQLYNASDPFGKLSKADSYVVLNNLGVSYYKLQRNSEFKASTYMQQALAKVPKSDSVYDIIEQNLAKLDEMVNSLD